MSSAAAPAPILGRRPSWMPNDNVTVINSRPVQYLLMKLRDKETQGRDFMVFADRLMRLLAEEALCRLPSITDDGIVETPIGTARKGLVRTDSGANMIQLLKISFRNAKFAVLTT
jgi:uracil phosphoribosyltransferase